MAKKYLKSEVNNTTAQKVKAKAERAEARINKPSPKYSDLTRKDWAEWGEGLRRLRNHGYSNPTRLSLVEMRNELAALERRSIQRAKDSLNVKTAWR